MRAIVLYDICRHCKHIAGVIMTPYVYFDSCVEKCLKAHLEEVYRAWNIRYDATTCTVYFTAGGAGPYDSSFKVQVMQKDGVTTYDREPIRLSTTGEIIEDH